MLRPEDHSGLRLILSLKDFLNLLLGAGTGAVPQTAWTELASLASCECLSMSWLGGWMSRTPRGAFFRLRAGAPLALLRWSCWMMAENLASSEGLPVLERGVGRELQFSLSWGGMGRWAGRGGLAGRVGGV